jgi:hypothetical protein
MGHGPRSFITYKAFIHMLAWQLMCLNCYNEATGQQWHDQNPGGAVLAHRPYKAIVIDKRIHDTVAA